MRSFLVHDVQLPELGNREGNSSLSHLHGETARAAPGQLEQKAGSSMEHYYCSEQNRIRDEFSTMHLNEEGIHCFPGNQ